jgi:hypothetical protein
MWYGWMQQYKLRKNFFVAGAALIVLGFVGQFIGSLPYGISYIGFKSCS